jgi:hypothetical protein
MKKLSMARIFKGLGWAAFLASAASGTALADDHLLSINGATVFLPATITDAGTVTGPLILTNFDGNSTLILGASQSLTVVRAFVKLCKPGTRGQLEWLNEGNAVVGVTGTLTSGTSSTVPSPNGYRLTLGMTNIVDTFNSSNGACTVLGQKTYTYTGTAVIDRRDGSSSNFMNKLTNTYNFGNVVNRAPEPETLVLMLTALLALGWVSARSVRTARSASRSR